MTRLLILSVLIFLPTLAQGQTPVTCTLIGTTMTCPPITIPVQVPGYSFSVPPPTTTTILQSIPTPPTTPSVATTVPADQPVGILFWGYSGTLRNREWVSPDGRMDIQTQIAGSPSAFDLWPGFTTPTPGNALSEITLHRCGWWQGCLGEQISYSAMPDAAGGDYRVSIEAGGGVFHNWLICFENVSPGLAYCPFKVGPDGVWVSDPPGGVWRKL